MSMDKKITLIALCPSDIVEEITTQLLKATPPDIFLKCTVEPLNGPIEPDEWLEGGPEVEVMGVWELWAPPYPNLVPDYLCHAFAIELALNGQPLRMVGWGGENGFVTELSWEIPEGMGPLLGCDEETARELMEKLGSQILEKFGTNPTSPRSLKAEFIQD